MAESRRGWWSWVERLFGGPSPTGRQAPEPRWERPPPAPTLSPVEPPPLPDYPPSAFDRELFDTLRANPDDPDPYSVVADWLTEQGDPRGRLVLAMRDGTLPVELLRKHAPALYGPLHDVGIDAIGPHDELVPPPPSGEPSDRVVSVVAGWRHGFVQRLWARPGSEPMDQPGPSPRAIAAFLDHPSCWVLRSLTLGGPQLDGFALRGPYPTVRALRIGDFSLDHYNLCYTAMGDWSGVAQSFPELDALYVQGTVDALDVPDTLTSFTLMANVVYGRVVRTVLARAQKLRHLELWTGSHDYGGDVRLEDLRGLGELELDHLGVRNSTFTDALVRWLVDEPMAGHLRTLDLSLGTLSDAGAAVLVEHRHAFGALTRLNLDENAIEAQREALTQAYGDVVEVGYQKPAPYVSVHE